MGSLPQLSVLKGPSRTLKPNRLDKLFENVANTSAANNIALIYEEKGKTKKYTYSDLNNLANCLSRVIHKNILDNSLPRNKDGDYIIAVSMEPSDYLVITLLAIWKCGAAYLPLDPSFPTTRIEHIINESRPVMVIFEKDCESFGKTFKLSLNNLFNSANSAFSNPLKSEERLHHIKDDLAIVLYTSGSTGVPKGVRLPHCIILNRLQWQFKTFPYGKNEKTSVFKTALTFVDSVAELWGPLINGLAILVMPKSTTQDPEKLTSVLENYQIERLVLVPSLLRSLLMFFSLQKNRKYLPNLKTWVCSGETLAVSLVEDFYKYFSIDDHKLCNFYGSTEIMGDVTYHVILHPEELKHQQKIPIGLPVDNTIVYLLDSDFRPVKAGDVGELFVSGLNLAAGYVNGRDPDKFIENPLAVDPMFARLYRTGDFAKLEKGTLFYEGRTDSQIKIRGYRVDLSEIEKAVNSVNGVDKGIVLCYKPGEINQAILAFVTTNAPLNEHEVETILKSKLTAYMIPQIVLIDEVPLLVNGKIDRQMLLKSYEICNDSNNNEESKNLPSIDYTGVRKSLMSAAKVLFEVVASVLNRSARAIISLDTNFYEVGGNSLNSIFTITKLNEHGYYISIGDFIAAMDLGEILDRMTSDKLNSLTKFISQPPCYSIEMLDHHHKNDVIDIITSSFYVKADLEQWIISEISELDYTELVEKLWEPLIEKDLSFVVKTESNKIVGVALSFDARDEPDVKIDSKLSVIFDFLESIEGPVRDSQLPPGQGKLLHSFMMGTKSTLTSKENITVIQFMEEETLKLAKRKNFAGIFTTNTSPLTQQLGTDVYGYETCLDYQVNEYVASDKSKPFGLAPDSQRALVQWKSI